MCVGMCVGVCVFVCVCVGVVCGCGWVWEREKVTERRGRGGSEHSTPHSTSPIQSIAHKTIAKFELLYGLPYLEEESSIGRVPQSEFPPELCCLPGDPPLAAHRTGTTILPH